VSSRFSPHYFWTLHPDTVERRGLYYHAQEKYGKNGGEISLKQFVKQVRDQRSNSVGALPDVPEGPPPYVARDVDDHLDRALTDNRFVLLVGDSGAGTTRTAQEAGRRVFPDAPLLVPAPDQTVRALVGPGGRRLPAEQGPVVLFLDQLDRHLGRPGGLDAGLLDQLAERDPPVLVLATLGSSARERLLAAGGALGQSARMVLRQATTVRLELRPSERERARAEVLYPGRDLGEGIGLRLGGGAELRRRLEGARGGVPVGWALVQAAVDWRRTGMARPVDEPTLRALAVPYLEDAGLAGELADERFEHGLAWAARHSGRRPPLLDVTGQPPRRRFEAPGHLAAAADGEAGGQPRDVPGPAWEAAIAGASAEELVGVGFTAYLRGQPELAARAWRAALHSGDPAAAAEAEANLAALAPVAAAALGDGRPAGAQPPAAAGAPEPARLRLLRTDDGTEPQPPAEDGDPAAGPEAALREGVAAEQRGDLEAARAAYRRVAGAGHAEAAAAAAANLGALLAQLGQTREARRALAQAMSSGHPDAAPFAAFALGTLYLQEGRPERAGEAFRWALRSGHPDQAPAAAISLSKLLAERGDLEGARAALERAVASGHPEQAPRAAVDLGLLLARQGDLAPAEVAFRAAVDAGPSDYRPWGLVGLGMVAAMRGDLEAALPAYLEAQTAGHPDAAQMALRQLRALTGTGRGKGRRRRLRWPRWDPPRPGRS